MSQRLFILAILPIFFVLSFSVLWSPAVAGEIRKIQVAQSEFQKLNGTWMTEKQSPDSENHNECLFGWKIDKAIISGENMSLILSRKNREQAVSGKIDISKMDFDIDKKLSVKYSNGDFKIYIQFAGEVKGDKIIGWYMGGREIDAISRDGGQRLQCSGDFTLVSVRKLEKKTIASGKVGNKKSTTEKEQRVVRSSVASREKGFDGEWVGTLKGEDKDVCGFESHPIKAIVKGTNLTIITRDYDSDVTLKGEIGSKGEVEFSGESREWEYMKSHTGLVSSTTADIEGQFDENKFNGSIVSRSKRGCYSNFTMERKINPAQIAAEKKEQERLAAEQTRKIEKANAEEKRQAKIARKKQEEEEARLAAEAAERKAEEARLAAEAEQKQQLAASAQQALKALGVYKGKADGTFGSKSQAALGAWLKRNGRKKTTPLDKAIVSELEGAAKSHATRQAAEAEAQRLAELERKRKEELKRKEEAGLQAEAKRKAEEARRRQIEAEKKRQAWEAAEDLARYKAAAKKAQQLLEGAQDYLRVNPGIPNLIIISEAVIKLANALKAKIGTDVEKTVFNLREIAAKSVEFTGHLEKLVTARQERERKTIANKVETLTAYKGQISKFIAANIAINIEAVQKLLPLVKVIDDVLSNPDLPGVLAAEAQVQKVISATPALKRSIAEAKAQLIAEAEKKRQAELARKQAEEEKRRMEKVAAERAEQEQRQAELARKQAEEEERRQAELQKQKEAQEKERATYNGKLLFTIVEAEDHFINDIEKDDSGKIVSADSQVGCKYAVKITNYLKQRTLVGRFKLESAAIAKSAEKVVSFVQLGMNIEPGKTNAVQPRFIIAKWLDQSRKTIPTQEQRENALKDHGCGAQKGSVYLAYDSPKSFLRVLNKRSLSKRKLKKIVVGNPQGVTPLRIQH